MHGWASDMMAGYGTATPFPCAFFLVDCVACPAGHAGLRGSSFAGTAPHPTPSPYHFGGGLGTACTVADREHAAASSPFRLCAGAVDHGMADADPVSGGAAALPPHARGTHAVAHGGADGAAGTALPWHSAVQPAFGMDAAAFGAGRGLLWSVCLGRGACRADDACRAAHAPVDRRCTRPGSRRSLADTGAHHVPLCTCGHGAAERHLAGGHAVWRNAVRPCLALGP